MTIERSKTRCVGYKCGEDLTDQNHIIAIGAGLIIKEGGQLKIRLGHEHIIEAPLTDAQWESLNDVFAGATIRSITPEDIHPDCQTVAMRGGIGMHIDPNVIGHHEGTHLSGHKDGDYEVNGS